MSRTATDKKKFFDLLHRAMQPVVPEAGETKERKKHGSYNGKQIRQRKSVNTSDSPNDKSRQ